MKASGPIYWMAFVGTVWAANWAITRFGVMPVGFGWQAPAGVWFAGLAFTLRDGIHETLSRGWVLGGIAAGALLSAWLSGPLAVASGAAFALSELLDYLVYVPLRRRGWLWAVAGSNVVGLVADSAAFLWLAFGSLEFLPGQVWAKMVMTILAVAIIAACRSARPPARA